MVSSKSLDQLTASAGRLFSLPAVTMQVLELTRNSQVDVKALRACLENDPAIASRVLRVVNSSLYAPTREITDLSQALNLLGIQPLKLLVLGFSLPSGLFLDLETKTLSWYWRHALTKAAAARALSRQFWRIPGDEAFLSGLFQDLGVLVLFQQLGQAYARFVDRAFSYNADLLALEKKALGFSHVDLSARLLKRWGFPDTLVNIVAWQPPLSCDTAMHQILCLAEWIARLLVDGQVGALEELLELGGLYCGNLKHHLEPLVADIEVQVKELSGILDLNLPDGLEYRDILAEAHRQLAGISTRVAGDLLRAGRPSRYEQQEDWFVDEFDALGLALAEACKRPPDKLPVPRSAKSKSEPKALPAAMGMFSAQDVPSAALPMGNDSSVALAERPKVASPNLLDRLTPIIAKCRAAARPISLLLLEIGNAQELLHLLGGEHVSTLRESIASMCAEIDYAGLLILTYGEYGLSLILPGAERREAIEIGDRLVRTLRRCNDENDSLPAAVKLGIGIATVTHPPRNFPPRDLLDGAARCLYASRASGGSMVKSIEIY